MNIKTLVTLGLLAAALQTPAQLLDQIDALLKQLRSTLATTTPAPTPSATAITTSAGLVSALKVGGAIALAPGTYTGNFVINQPTILTGAGQSATILVPADKLTPPLVVKANDVAISELAVKNGALDRETVVVGDLAATTVDAQPHRVKLSHVTITAASGGHRGLSLHGVDLTVDACTITGFWDGDQDAQAIWINNGPGPYTITNSTLEASGENILVGGDDPPIPNVVPSDIVIRGNTIRKPAIYRTLVPGGVKNLLELKNARRVLIEGNTFDGNWASGQSGNAIVFTVRNQGGKCPWCVVDDVTFRGNVLTNTLDGFGVNILGKDDAATSAQTLKIVIDHNLFADSPAGVQVLNGPTQGLVITNNTFPKITQRLLQFGASGGWAKVPIPLTFSRNVAKTGAYGIMGDGSTGPGLPSLTANAAIVEWTGNIIEMTNERTISLPAGTTIVPYGGLLALLDAKYKLLSGAAGY